jgi:hypothetical protein
MMPKRYVPPVARRAAKFTKMYSGAFAMASEAGFHEYFSKPKR